MIMFGRWKRSRKKPQPAAEFMSVAGRTFIGDQVHMEGIIRCREDLFIDGSVKGTIELANHRLTVGEMGRVDAEIHAQNATISGRVKGSILSRGKIEITRHGQFTGQIEAGGVAVADGADLRAVIQLTRDPAAYAIAANGPLEKGPASGKIHMEKALNQGNGTCHSAK
jgi:cytoskeletal protein CcmA (bactofilin family)